jgi:hypothetical protein
VNPAVAAGFVSNDTEYLAPLRVSTAASRTIDAWVSLLASGTLSLAALPLPLFSLYELGVSDGRQQREPEVRAAKLEADRLWLQCFGESERREYLLSRLDRAAQLANRPDVDNVLDEAWRIYCASLNDVRSEVTL